MGLNFSQKYDHEIHNTILENYIICFSGHKIDSNFVSVKQNIYYRIKNINFDRIFSMLYIDLISQYHFLL